MYTRAYIFIGRSVEKSERLYNTRAAHTSRRIQFVPPALDNSNNNIGRPGPERTADF